MKKILSLVLLVALPFAAFAGCTSAPPPAASPVPVIDESTGSVASAVPTITVNGEGELELTPDMATLELGVEERQHATAKEAIEANAQAMDAVMAALKAQGIEEKDMQTSNFHLYTNYNYDTNGNIVGKPKYSVSNSLTVTIYAIDKIGDIIDAAVDAGATMSYGMSFGLKDTKEKETEALLLAYENARSRAEALAAATGKQIGSVLLLNDGTQIAEQIYTEVPYARAEAAYDMAAGNNASYKTSVSAGSMKVTAKVSVRFTLV